jgi:hypothetical protein
MNRGLLLGLCAFLAVLAAFPTAAGAATCAPKLGQVKGFHGHADAIYNTTASGKDSEEGGYETITQDHEALDLRVDLRKGHRIGRTAKRGILFAGFLTHGDVEIEDTFTHTGTGFTGALNYSDPIVTGPMAYGQAHLEFDRRKNKCKYEFGLAFFVQAEFSGDEEIKPFTGVGGSAESGRLHIPGSLKLSREIQLPGLPDCSKSSEYIKKNLQGRCYDWSGGWDSQFNTLATCHSVSGINCNPGGVSTGAVGVANMQWSLLPIYKKHHKKK